jgi:hypothetical protein
MGRRLSHLKEKSRLEDGFSFRLSRIARRTIHGPRGASQLLGAGVVKLLRDCKV